MSLMLVPLESSSAVLVMISSRPVSICNRRSQARQASSSEITIPLGGGVVGLFDALAPGEPPNPAAQNLITRN